MFNDLGEVHIITSHVKKSLVVIYAAISNKDMQKVRHYKKEWSY